MNPRYFLPLAIFLFFTSLCLTGPAKAGDFIEKTIGYRKDGSPIVLTVYQSGKTRKATLNRRSGTTLGSYGVYSSYPYGYAPLIRRPRIIHRPIPSVRPRPTRRTSTISRPSTVRPTASSRRPATSRSKPAGRRR